ncbi:MAG: histidine kinase, partial [Rubrivivax sp.]|nr:histidine kinase [Rubrivivax sp.]
VWKHPAWRIVVRDDGRGFDREAVAPDAEAHVGLRIMNERAARLGATLQVDSQPGVGTTVTLQLPGQGGDAAPRAGGAAAIDGTAASETTTSATAAAAAEATPAAARAA